MIKIFGQVRYHWQPQLSILIIYWSLSLVPIFLGLALMYESSRIPMVVLSSFVLFMILMGIGFHRYFTIYDSGTLRIISANPFHPSRLAIDQIQKIEVTKTSITLYLFGQEKGLTYYMRKWPKKYFVNALALNPHFRGEVVLTDHLIHLDYYEVYYQDKG
ncbi:MULTISPECIES: EbsA family protein [unclassified Streptococcus]|uniref:EbsA family protein n=1 Tax=unclassified Streptococcus TaxID=2608887 RepID=UPI0018AB0F32|nr:MULTISPECIES: EbsA family protein [unclassified Streptococcus]MBF8970884.1 EbsA family protein [Streptococcus sp. NLN76]MBG9367039.1 EbsA family protein [Streptococcus sp. NLN64]MBJ6745463.1 EbsA family protein [Streptococcus sp. 121]